MAARTPGGTRTGHHGPELPEQRRPAARRIRAGQRGGVLLPERPGLPARLVSRPLARDHPPQRLRRHRLRLRHLRRLRAGDSSPRHHLPGPLDPRTVYLVFQDKIFVSDAIAKRDPTWPTIMPHSRPGDLWYAHVYDPDRWDLAPEQPAGPPPDPSVVPEFFGDTMLVNGTVYPYLEVEQRQYRFRLLNACQARFLNPRLVYAKALERTTEPRQRRRPGVRPVRDGGRVPARPRLPRRLVARGSQRVEPIALLLAPAERADLIVDFRNVPAGARLILFSDARPRSPMGDAAERLLPGQSETPRSSRPGFGPNTRTLLQIRVKARVGRGGSADPPAGSAAADRSVRASPSAGRADRNPATAAVRRADPQRGLRRARPADPVPRHGPAAVNPRGRRVRPGVPRPADRDRQGRDRGGLGDRQPDRRHAPDPLPPGQRAGPVAPGVRRGALRGRSPDATPGRRSRRTPTSSAGRRPSG